MQNHDYIIWSQICSLSVDWGVKFIFADFAEIKMSKLAVRWPREQAAHGVKASTRALTFDCISAFEQNWIWPPPPAKYRFKLQTLKTRLEVVLQEKFGEIQLVTIIIYGQI